MFPNEILGTGQSVHSHPAGSASQTTSSNVPLKLPRRKSNDSVTASFSSKYRRKRCARLVDKVLHLSISFEIVPKYW